MLVAFRAPETNVEMIEVVAEVSDDTDMSTRAARVLEPRLELGASRTVTTSEVVQHLLQAVVEENHLYLLVA